MDKRERFFVSSCAFSKGLTFLAQSHQNPGVLADVVTDAYEALEALAKIITGRNDRDLSANRELFLSKLKISQEYKEMLRSYITYANEFRHAAEQGKLRPEITTREVESFVYITGIFIRLGMNV